MIFCSFFVVRWPFGGPPVALCRYYGYPFVALFSKSEFIMARPKLLSQNKKGKLTYWCKKIDGKRHYFGNVKTTTEAQARRSYLNQLESLESGIQDSAPAKGATLSDLYNHFFYEQKKKHENGEIVYRTLKDYENAVKLLSKTTPLSTRLEKLTATHFKKMRDKILTTKEGKKRSPIPANTLLGHCRTIFKFASRDNFLIDRPLPCESAFKKISAKVVRKHRARKAPRLLEPEEIKQLIETADVNYKPVFWLAINGGWNNSDLKNLTLNNLGGLNEGVIDYAREKTGIQRTTPLWPETIKAIKKWFVQRPDVDHDFVFVSLQRGPRFGTPLLGEEERKCRLSSTMERYCKKLGIDGPGKNFGAFRSTFANVGTQVADDATVKACMGHLDGSVLYTNYARKKYLPKLKQVTDHVREWLLG
jgi:integrase